MDIHKNEKNELRLWAKDDIVPSDLRELCKQAAASIAKLQERIKELKAENKQLKSEEPIPFAWWKDCPKLAQKSMERVIETNDQQAERIQELEADLKIKQSVCETIKKEVTAINNKLKYRIKELEACIINVCNLINNEGKVSKWKILNWLE